MANIQYYDVILKPVITEKSMDLMADKRLTRNTHSLYTQRRQRIRSKRLLKRCSAARK